MRRLLISRLIAAPYDVHVFDLDAKEPIDLGVQVHRHHFLSFAYYVADKDCDLIGTLSPKNFFRDVWEIQDAHSRQRAIVSRQIPEEWFTEYQMATEWKTVCIFRQNNTVTATEFVAEFPEELEGWSESLLISIPLVLMASNPLICSVRSEAQGGSG